MFKWVYVNPLAPKTPEILLQVHDEIKHRKNFFCQTNAMFLYVFEVALHDHVVRFHFEIHKEIQYGGIFGKSHVKNDNFFFLNPTFVPKTYFMNGTKWHKIVDLSKYALVHNQNSTWRPQNSRQSQENAKK